MYYKIFVLAFFIYSCHDNENAHYNNKSHKQMRPSESQSGQNKIKENEIKKQSVIISSNNKKRTFPKANKKQSLEYSSNSIITKKPRKEIANKNRELINEYQQKKEKWNAFYSEDSTWLDLYKTTESSFIKGCEHEFIKNPNLINTINKPFLVNLFSRKMEKLFYNSPSFIQFSTDRFKTSEAFARFQTNWKIPD